MPHVKDLFEVMKKMKEYVLGIIINFCSLQSNFWWFYV